MPNRGLALLALAVGCQALTGEFQAVMLAAQSIVSAEDADRIVAGLQDIHASIERGEFEWDEAKEDVHMNIEARLIEKIGPVGGNSR